MDIIAFIAIFAGAMYIVITVSMVIMWSVVGLRQINATRHFYHSMTNGLENKMIKDFNDIENLFLSQFNKNDALFKRLLKKYFYKLADNKIESNNIELARNLINTSLVTVNSRMYYTGLPEHERVVFEEIEQYCNESSDLNIDTIKNRVISLACTINEKNNKIHKSEKYNRISIPLAIIGVALTIGFGIASLLQNSNLA